MYKLQIMIKKSADDDFIKMLKENVLTHLEKASGKNLVIGKIVGAKLMEEPYQNSCELRVESKEMMDELLNTSDGKKFNRNITSLMGHLSLFFIEYGE